MSENVNYFSNVSKIHQPNTLDFKST